jgi:hypothetical protein
MHPHSQLYTDPRNSGTPSNESRIGSIFPHNRGVGMDNQLVRGSKPPLHGHKTRNVRYTVV